MPRGNAVDGVSSQERIESLLKRQITKQPGKRGNTEVNINAVKLR
jgi:hypothetical protein